MDVFKFSHKYFYFTELYPFYKPQNDKNDENFFVLCLDTFAVDLGMIRCMKYAGSQIKSSGTPQGSDQRKECDGRDCVAQGG